MAPNQNLNTAKRAKNDEFYTRYVDIELEMAAYLAHDPTVFQGKTVLLPCDDADWSSFTQYFARNFEKLGLAKLVSTCYRAGAAGKLFVHTSGDADINPADLAWVPLNGDGDFRSAEVTALRDEADLVITNPPFSLFRAFMAWVTEADKQYAVVGNMNAVTYIDVFPLIQTGQMWLGATNLNGSCFRTTQSRESETTPDEATNLVSVVLVTWFTNIDHGNRPPPLVLLTAAENEKSSKHAKVRGVGYQKYDNFDAIEVPFVDAIPSDYGGIMGVPITFIGKYNPAQFEILGNMEDHAQNRELGVTPLSEEFIAAYRAAGGTGHQQAGRYYTGLTGPNRFPYKRIFIRHRRVVA